MIEALVVVAILAVLTAMAVPQMISARRLMRSAALPTLVASQLRFARQQAMSQSQAFTFQYDNGNKTIKIFDHNNTNNITAACNMTGQAVLTQPNFPNTVCSTTVLTTPMATGGSLPASEVSYGVPASGIASAALGDGNVLTNLQGTVVNITFLSNGTAIDANGLSRAALYFYNNKVPVETASAVSVLGGSGRIKVWRYSKNASKYVE